MFHPRVESKMRESIDSFRKLEGNEMFSEELFLMFLKHMRKNYTVYDELADTAGLLKTGTPGSYVQEGGVSYFKQTEHGFIDITYIKRS